MPTSFQTADWWRRQGFLKGFRKPSLLICWNSFRRALSALAILINCYWTVAKGSWNYGKSSMLIATAEISYSSCCKNECRRAQYTIRTLLTWKIALCHNQCCCLHDRYCHAMVNPSCHDQWHEQGFLSWKMAWTIIPVMTNGKGNAFLQDKWHSQFLSGPTALSMFATLGSTLPCHDWFCFKQMLSQCCQSCCHKAQIRKGQTKG